MALTGEQRRRIAEIAKEIDELTGGWARPDGSPKTFAEIENDSIEATDLLAAEAMKLAAKGRTDEPPAICSCSICGRSCERQAAAETQLVQTDRGEIGWNETIYRCRKCRQTFSPSGG